MRGLDSDDHGATTPASACARAQECAVPMSAVQAQLQLYTGGVMGTNPQNAAQLVVNEPVMAEKHSLRMGVTRRNN
jgi:hypothetical protein